MRREFPSRSPSPNARIRGSQRNRWVDRGEEEPEETHWDIGTQTEEEEPEETHWDRGTQSEDDVMDQYLPLKKRPLRIEEESP